MITGARPPGVEPRLAERSHPQTRPRVGTIRAPGANHHEGGDTPHDPVLARLRGHAHGEGRGDRVPSGEGVLIRDTNGREYIDATAALWYCNVGFGRTEIARAAAAQMERLVAYSSFGRYTTEPTVQLAERLAALSPIDDPVVFLTSGGSDSVDTAAKLARRYWEVMGKPERRVIVSREHGYHGMHAWGTALSGIPGNKAGYAGDIIEEVVTVGAADTESLGRFSSDAATRSPRSSASRSSVLAGSSRPSPTTGARSPGCAASTTCCSSRMRW